MNRFAKATAVLFLLAPAPLAAEGASVEVMHFWTSGGEAAALATVRDKVLDAGIAWEDAPVAGGGGDQAKTALQARMAAGNPPAAMLMLGQNIIDWSNAGLLGDVTPSPKPKAGMMCCPRRSKPSTRSTETT